MNQSLYGCDTDKEGEVNFHVVFLTIWRNLGALLHEKRACFILHGCQPRVQQCFRAEIPERERNFIKEDPRIVRLRRSTRTGKMKRVVCLSRSLEDAKKWRATKKSLGEDDNAFMGGERDEEGDSEEESE
jgi:hypothetical protein